MKNKLYKLPELYEKLQNNNLKQTISSIKKVLKIITMDLAINIYMNLLKIIFLIKKTF